MCISFSHYKTIRNCSLLHRGKVISLFDKYHCTSKIVPQFTLVITITVSSDCSCCTKIIILLTMSLKFDNLYFQTQNMQKNLVLFSFRKLITFFFVFRAYADNLRNLFSIMPLMIIAVKDPLTRTSYQKELITAGEITAEDLVAEFRLTTQDFKKQGKFLYHNNWCKVLLGQGEDSQLYTF